MTLAFRNPPFLWLIRLFVGTPPDSAVYTYGRTCYVPSGHPLSPDLEAHEREHTNQQGRVPWLWWARYLVDRRFRYRQELAAYRAQLAHLRAQRKPTMLATVKFASLLSSSLYGHVCSGSEAQRALKAVS